MATVDEANSSITVSTDKDTVQNGPTFDDDQEISPTLAKEILQDPSEYYVNVHNAEFPGGALRGQLSR